MDSNCKDIKTSIDSLLVELCSQQSQSNNQGIQEQVCNPYRNSAMLESDLVEQKSQNESGLTNHIDSAHIKSHKKDPLVSRGDLETGPKFFDRESTDVKNYFNIELKSFSMIECIFCKTSHSLNEQKSNLNQGKFICNSDSWHFQPKELLTQFENYLNYKLKYHDNVENQANYMIKSTQFNEEQIDQIKLKFNQIKKLIICDDNLLKDCSVKLQGSLESELQLGNQDKNFENSIDLDIMVNDQSQKLSDDYCLNKLQDLFCRKNNSLVKLQQKYLNIDISVNKKIPIINTNLLKTQKKIDPLVFKLVRIVKYWAKTQKIDKNNKECLGLNSQTWTLLVIFYLRTQKILPNLQNIIVEKDNDFNLIVKQIFNSYEDRKNLKPIQKHQEYDIYFYKPENFEIFKSDNLRFKFGMVNLTNRISFKEIIVGFFKFQSEFNWIEQILDFKYGIRGKKSYQTQKKMCIVDPFEHDNDWFRDLGKNSNQFLVKAELDNAYTILRKYRDLKLLLNSK